MLKDAFAAIKRLLLLEERISRMNRAQDADHALLMDLQARIIRIEAFIEISTARRRGADPTDFLQVLPKDDIEE